VVSGDVYHTPDPHYLLRVRADDAERARPLIEEYRKKAESGALQADDAELPNEAVVDVGQFSRRKWFFSRLLLAVVIIVLVLMLIAIIPQLIRR